MNKFIWKYGHVTTICRCEEIEKYVNFTTLCSMFNPITSGDYNKYHKNIDLVLKKLKYLGFKLGIGVLLVSHKYIEKKRIEILLKQDII